MDENKEVNVQEEVGEVTKAPARHAPYHVISVTEAKERITLSVKAYGGFTDMRTALCAAMTDPATRSVLVFDGKILPISKDGTTLRAYGEDWPIGRVEGLSDDQFATDFYKKKE